MGEPEGDMKMPNLVVGNPVIEPASFTRFVLPFAYHLEGGPRRGGPVFEPIKSSEDREWRKRYLTAETEFVLFERALWLRIEPEAWGDVTFQARFPRGAGSPRRVPVTIAPPVLILFEDPASPVRGRHPDELDPLKIGFLVLEAHFGVGDDGPPCLDDLLLFNELFRYWQQPYRGHEKGADPWMFREVLAEAPIRLEDPGAGAVRDGSCPEIYFARWASLLESQVRIGGHLRRLAPERWEEAARRRSREHCPEVGWDVYADPRAFVWACAIVEGGGAALRHRFSSVGHPPQRLGHWVKLLNVDKPASAPEETHKTTSFERAWAKERTYHRWADLGSFYGFSYHSGAMLAPGFTEPPLWKYFGQMYFDQELLLLYVRVALFRFSDRLTRISKKMRSGDGADETWVSDFNRLREDFALFTNLYQFPLPSNQQQSVEMYAIARRAMDLDELFAETKEEIESTHEFLLQKQGHRLTESSVKLAVVATVGLAIGLAVGALNVTDFMKWLSDTVGHWLGSVLVFVFFGVLLVLIVRKEDAIYRWLERLSSRGKASRRTR